MKAVILAGGLGARLAEETQFRPKPMVEIGGKPILWHLMKIYSEYGINDFIICCGYLGYMIKEYFANYPLHTADVTIDMAANGVRVLQQHTEPWRVSLIDTGDETQTGGRLKRIAPYVEDEDAFCFTYGDGLANIDVAELIRTHVEHGRLATVTAVRPPGRFGALELTDGRVTGFTEKPPGDGGFINGGFFVLSPRCIDYVEADDTPWESDPLHDLAADGQLMAYEHRGFWQPMDTLRDKRVLEEMWASGEAPWKVW